AKGDDDSWPLTSRISPLLTTNRKRKLKLNTTEAHERRQSQEALRVAQEAKVNEALEQHELAKAARRSASPPPERHAGAGADLPEGMASGTHVMEISSTTHRKEWATLSRVAKGPRASEFPEVARLFQGTKAQKLEVLKAFVERGSLEAIEASFQATRQHDDSLQVKRKLMTLDEMNAAGFSEHLACMAKEKKLGCIRRGAVPDPDAPNCQKSQRFWVNVGTEQTTTERQTLTTSMQAGIRGSDAMSAMGMMLPTPTLSVADPVALARQQQAAVAQSP
ncbi:unnamed protein product, partial [Durusdinium trenchii]